MMFFLKKRTDHGPYVRHEISFRCLETKVDRFCVFADDYTATGVVSSCEKEVVGTSSGRHLEGFEEKQCPDMGRLLIFKHGPLLSF